MAMAHVFAEADVGNDQQFGQFLFQEPNGFLDDAVSGVGAGGFLVFLVGDAEEKDGGHAGRSFFSFLTISSGESWNTPGMEPTGWRSLRPLRAKSGSTSFPGSIEFPEPGDAWRATDAGVADDRLEMFQKQKNSCLMVAK